MSGTADAVSQVGVSSTSMGGASALSLPPTARHTPFRFGDLDERQYAACSAAGIPASSISYPNPVTESPPFVSFVFISIQSLRRSTNNPIVTIIISFVSST